MKNSHRKATPDHPQYRSTRRGEEHRSPLDVEGAAVYLGTTVRHVRRLVAERRVPFVKLGGKVRLLPDDLDRFLDAQRVEAAEPWDAA